MESLSMLLHALQNPPAPVIRSVEKPIAEPQYMDELDKVLPGLQESTGLPFDTPEARQLLHLTKAVESENGKFLKNFRGSSARGPYQIIDLDHNDVHENYLRFHPKTRKYVSQYKRDRMDPNYSAALARIHYWRFGEKQNGKGGTPLPKVGDIEGAAKYWAKFYHTKAGRKDIARAVRVYKKYYGRQ